MNCRGVSLVKDKKVLLNDVTFVGLKGNVTGIIGPSGAGKTTLVNCLLGKIHGNDGQVSIGGKVGYVMAKDALYPFLTVLETLQGAARLRLPGNLTDAQREKAVISVTDMMKLGSVLHQRVGDESGHYENNSISRGERRRLSIALELLSCPDILILDEPTTGIDSRLAYELVLLLRRLAKPSNGGRGMTIIMTLHQPSNRILDNIDRLTLLKAGSVIYQGPVKKAEAYFLSLNFVRPEYSSVADFMLEIASQHHSCTARPVTVYHTGASIARSSSVDGETRHLRSVASNVTDVEPYHTPVCLGATNAMFNARFKPPCELLADCYRYSEEAAAVKELIKQQEEEVSSKAQGIYSMLFSPRAAASSDRPVIAGTGHMIFQASWWTQFVISCSRARHRRLRNWKASLAVYVAVVIQACIFGFVFLGVGTPLKHLQTLDNSFELILNHPLLRYFSHGIDNGRPILTDNYVAEAERSRRVLSIDTPELDPLQQLLSGGVNTLTGSSIVLDVVYSFPQFASYFTDLAICYRSALPTYRSNLKSNGTLQIDDERKINSKDNLVQWRPPSRNITVSPELPDVDDILAAVSAVPQILYILGETNVKWPSLEKYHSDMINVFVPAALKGSVYATPLLCCAGSTMPFSLINTKFSKKCAQMFANYKVATPPTDWQWYNPGHSIIDIAQTVHGNVPPPSPMVNETEYASPLIEDLINGTLYSRPEHIFPEPPDETTTEDLDRVKGDLMDIVDDPVDTLLSVLSGKSADVVVRKATRQEVDNRRQLLGKGGFSQTISEVTSTFTNSHPTVTALLNKFSAVQDRLAKCKSGTGTETCRFLNDLIHTGTTYAADALELLAAFLNIQGVVLFLLINIGFMASEVFMDVIRYRVPLNREVDSGLIKPSAHIIANMLIDAPFQLVMPFIMTTSLLVFIGIPRTMSLPMLYFSVWLYSWAAYAVCYLVASTVYRIDMGVIILCCVMSVMLMVIGMFIPDANLPLVLQYVKYFSIFRYGYNLIMSIVLSSTPDIMSLTALLGLGSIYRCLTIVSTSLFYRGLGKESC